MYLLSNPPKAAISCLMAMAQLQTGAETGFGRRLWLFDTFEGMPKPRLNWTTAPCWRRHPAGQWQQLARCRRMANGTLQRAPGSVRDKNTVGVLADLTRCGAR